MLRRCGKSKSCGRFFPRGLQELLGTPLAFRRPTRQMGLAFPLMLLWTACRLWTPFFHAGQNWRESSRKCTDLPLCSHQALVSVQRTNTKLFAPQEHPRTRCLGLKYTGFGSVGSASSSPKTSIHFVSRCVLEGRPSVRPFSPRSSSDGLCLPTRRVISKHSQHTGCYQQLNLFLRENGF